MESRRLVVVVFLVVALALVSASAIARNAGVEQSETPENYSEASDLAPVPSPGTEQGLARWGLWLGFGLLALAGVVYLIRPKV